MDVAGLEVPQEPSGPGGGDPDPVDGPVDHVPVHGVGAAPELPGHPGEAVDQAVEDPRGEVNGRSFEFVSTKPDGTEWTFRIRGNSLWVGFVEKTTTGELGAIQLSGKERRKLWELIDMVDVGGRKKSKPDPENGTVAIAEPLQPQLTYRVAFGTE